MYDIVYSKKYDKPIILKPGERLEDNLSFCHDLRYSYKLRVRGDVNVPYQHRTEDLFPIYFRKIEDSLIKDGDSYALSFSKFNLVYERSCYCMVTDITDYSKDYDFTVNAKASGTDNNFKITAEVYYGKKHSRYYYEQPDEVHTFEIKDSLKNSTYSKKIVFSSAVDFVMIKISALGFNGDAVIECPKLISNGKNYIPAFEYAPEKIGDQKWIGEGFSLTERPHFNVRFNDQTIFNGNKTDRLHHLSGVEFKIFDVNVGENNRFSITYSAHNKINYAINEIQLIRLPKELEILGVQKIQRKGEPFGVFCHFENDCTLTVKTDDNLSFIGSDSVKKGYGVLEFMPLTEGQDVSITISDGKSERKVSVTVIDKPDDGVLTGSGDFIYINQNYDDFYEYIAWYVNENIGDMLTLRSSYRWGGTAESDQTFWKTAVDVIKKLGLRYVLMVDGRELNGVNANPPVSVLKSKQFLGEQTHERDGAFTYWTQDVNEYEAFFYHLLSRKLERNGIYGKFSPVYDKQGNPRIYYAGDDVTDVKKAYEKLVYNLSRTASDGATRHTGVTPLFSAFFDAGYKWLGYESMYGNHEIIFGALRGMSNSIGQKSFGAHLALQWSTVPCDELGHALRYRLALYSSYMNGASHINTEEGLWNIENPFEGFDRFSYACNIHKKEQQDFNSFVKTHKRHGNQVRKIAMMVGIYDGMDCFSTGSVYGQRREFWEYSTPEYSWDLLKVFYPQAKIGAIYHFVKQGGNSGLREKDVEFLKAWPNLYGGEALDYQSLGYHSETPYGVIDLISGNAENLSDYSFIFLTGWNSCSSDQLERFCKYLENGGKLMLSKSHLFDSVSRKDVLTGQAKTIDSPLKEKLLSFREKGNLIYFEQDGYPIEFKDKYANELTSAGKEFGCQFVKDVDAVSFTEYRVENLSTVLYLMNIRWWNKISATFTLNLKDSEYKVVLKDNTMKLIAVTPDKKRAVMLDSLLVDIDFIDDEKFTLKGYGKAKVTVFTDGKEKDQEYTVKGTKDILFK